MADRNPNLSPGWAERKHEGRPKFRRPMHEWTQPVERKPVRQLGPIVIAIPKEQMTPEVAEELGRLGAKVMGHPNPALLLRHLRAALRTDDDL